MKALCKGEAAKAVLRNAFSVNTHIGQNMQIQSNVPGNVFCCACFNSSLEYGGMGGSVISSLNCNFVMSFSELRIRMQYCKVSRRWHCHCTDFQGSRYALPCLFSVLSRTL